jgi:hypothetical protein
MFSRFAVVAPGWEARLWTQGIFALLTDMLGATSKSFPSADGPTNPRAMPYSPPDSSKRAL